MDITAILFGQLTKLIIDNGTFSNVLSAVQGIKFHKASSTDSNSCRQVRCDSSEVTSAAVALARCYEILVQYLYYLPHAITSYMYTTCIIIVPIVNFTSLYAKRIFGLTTVI